ncbi:MULTISPECIES: hypothetical protein [unclassified Pseudomonas]|uniref:hypothetical protein n=1 Tax=unclassified Pseudomonas TaxID=196821 RepID=UPI001F12D06D|nr:hypothetical protein [Pseudomonas sp. LS.1a]UMY63250.1 hypothetical protein MKK04_08460 [Pseudomonas sp. LS.1a]
MLKLVSDPPFSTDPSIMTLAVVHEMEAVRTLLESAIAQVQLRGRQPVHTLH